MSVHRCHCPRAQRERLERELDDLHQQLHDLRGQRRESQRDKEIDAHVEELKQRFKGEQG